MLAWVLIFLGGGLGSVFRHALASGVMHWTGRTDPGHFPLGTLLVNVVGCLLIGVAAAWIDGREPVRSLVIVGILGGFTTYSSFGLDTVRLLEAGEVGKAVEYVLITTAAGLLAVWISAELGSIGLPITVEGD